MSASLLSIIITSLIYSSYTAAVEGVDVKVVNDTSVAVSWNVVIIPGFSIDYYTLVYSQASHFRRQDEEMFPSPTTSFVITDLKSTDTYQFQVFATVIVDGRILNGERSSPVYFTRPRKCTRLK